MNFSIRRITTMPGVWRLRLLQALARWGVREETLLIVLAIFIGLAAGAGGWVFERCLHAVQQCYFVGLSEYLRATTTNLFLLPFLPAAGGLAVVAVRKILRRPETSLHGVTAVLYALIRKASTLSRLAGVETLFASCFTIGSGGSAGPEAPIVVIGSSIGSLTGTLAGISRRNLPTLIGCGAAAGISAVFNAPIAGVLFALEVMLRDFSIKTFTPIVITAVVSTVTYQTITGDVGGGIFAMPTGDMLYRFTFQEMPNYILLGIVCGLLAVFLTKFLFLIELFFHKLHRVPQWARPALGGVLCGLCGVALILTFRNAPHMHVLLQNLTKESSIPIFGDGYPSIHRAIDPRWYTGKLLDTGDVAVITLPYLAIICLLKVFATSFTLGSGGSGGVFAPALYVGATGGGAVGLLLRDFSPHATVEPSSYALVGMGAVLAAAIQAPLMAIMMLFELTRNYQVMLPAMLAVVTATLIQQWIVKDSVFTLPLRAHGVHIGAPVGVGRLRRISLDQITLRAVQIVGAGDPVLDLVKRMENAGVSDFVVTDPADRYLGLVTIEELKPVMFSQEALPLLLAGDVLRSDIPSLAITDTLETALELFARHDSGIIPVFETDALPSTGKALKGLLSRSDAMRRYYAELSG